MRASGATSREGGNERSGMGDVGVPGVENTAGLTRWIRDNDLPGAGGDLTVDLFAGGPSNLTYRLEFPAPRAAPPRDPPPRPASPLSPLPPLLPSRPPPLPLPPP